MHATSPENSAHLRTHLTNLQTGGRSVCNIVENGLVQRRSDARLTLPIRELAGSLELPGRCGQAAALPGLPDYFWRVTVFGYDA